MARDLALQDLLSSSAKRGLLPLQLTRMVESFRPQERPRRWFGTRSGGELALGVLTPTTVVGPFTWPGRLRGPEGTLLEPTAGQVSSPFPEPGMAQKVRELHKGMRIR